MRKIETNHFDQEGFSGDVYVSDIENSGFDALRISVHGRHPLKEITETIRVYLVISGTGTFTLNGTTKEVQKDDLYIVEPGNSYEYEGDMELFEFNVIS